MSKAKLSQIKIPPEARKFPFDQTFLCPKCSEILFVKIHYIDATMIPQVKYKCPKRHSGTVDLLLFFSLFHSSNKEIEEDLSKFDEKLEKDIELFKTKKMKDRKKILDPINFAKIINKKNKEKEKEKEEEQNKEKNNIEETENKNKEEIKQEKEKEEENKKLFVQIQKCNEIKFSLFNIKKEKELKIIEKLEKQHPKSESRTAEKVEDNSPDEKNNPKKINKSNKNSLSPKSKVNNINIIKKETSKEKEKEKEDSKEKKEEKKEEIKIKEKETKEEIDLLVIVFLVKKICVKNVLKKEVIKKGKYFPMFY